MAHCAGNCVFKETQALPGHCLAKRWTPCYTLFEIHTLVVTLLGQYVYIVIYDSPFQEFARCSNH